MRKVNKNTYNEIDNLYSDLTESLTHFEDLSAKINENLPEWIRSFKTEGGKDIFSILEDIKEAKGELNEQTSDIVSSAESYQEGRSSKWLASDIGCNYNDWVEQWKDLNNMMNSPVYWFTLNGCIEDDIAIDAGIEEISPLPSQQPDGE